MTNDPHHIVPRGALYARSRSIDLQVRTMIEYDIDRLRDRLRSELFADGRPIGIYSVAEVDDDMIATLGPAETLRLMAPRTEVAAVDELVGNRYRERISQLEDRVASLEAHLNRPRWWQWRRRRAAH